MIGSLMTSSRLHARLALALILAFVPIPASAEPSAADRQTARTLLLEGRKKLQSGDAAGALADFKAAHAIMHVPTTGLDLARAQEALGALVEARATATEVVHLPAAPNEPAAFVRARAEAVAMVERLEARIPALVLRIEGATADRVEVRVDGDLVPADALAAPRRLNPGPHEVVASSEGFRTERREVTLQDGVLEPVEVHLVLTKIPVPAPAAPPPRPAPPPPAPRDAPVPVWVWAAGGAGLAALAGSVGFTADHLAARARVDEECPGGVCDRSRHDQESMDALRARWNRSLGLAVGLGAVGAAGVSVAVWGLVTRPQRGREAAMVVPIVTPAAQGISWMGAF